jgi:GT2 family glycosyltransferase
MPLVSSKDLLGPERAPKLTYGVVVIGRNEGKRLIDCLTAIAPKTIFTVYVDSGSTDDSVAAAERLGATVVKLDVAQPFTAARARNEGFAALKARRGDIRFVQFVDGDCELDAGWVATALDFFARRDDIAVVCGRRRERHPEMSVYNWLCDMEWDTPIGETTACGGDSLVRTEAFEAIGGFRSQLIAGEEPEFCLRLRESNWKIWRLDAEMTRHDAAITRFGQWWRRAVRSGYAYAEVFQLHAHSPAAIWKREVVRASFWGGFVPIAILLCALVKPIAIALVLVYPLQICRIALRRGPMTPGSWAYALFITLAKFAEFQGIMKFLWRRRHGQPVALIEYK